MTSKSERDQIELDLHTAVMNNLRRLIAEVEQEQRFEETMKKGIKPFKEAPPYPDEVELASLLQSLMVPSNGPSETQDTEPNVSTATTSRPFGL